jgi:hypothetical protein
MGIDRPAPSFFFKNFRNTNANFDGAPSPASARTTFGGSGWPTVIRSAWQCLRVRALHLATHS